jgi:hypothetical protein
MVRLSVILANGMAFRRSPVRSWSAPFFNSWHSSGLCETRTGFFAFRACLKTAFSSNPSKQKRRHSGHAAGAPSRPQAQELLGPVWRKRVQDERATPRLRRGSILVGPTIYSQRLPILPKWGIPNSLDFRSMEIGMSQATRLHFTCMEHRITLWACHWR